MVGGEENVLVTLTMAAFHSVTYYLQLVPFST